MLEVARTTQQYYRERSGSRAVTKRECGHSRRGAGQYRGPTYARYIIKADNLIGSSEAPAAPGENEIIVASLEELRAAPLNNKRLLALRNGLPGVDPVSKVGNREALLGRLWSTLESLPDPQAPRATKQSAVIAMLCRP